MEMVVAEDCVRTQLLRLDHRFSPRPIVGRAPRPQLNADLYGIRHRLPPASVAPPRRRCRQRRAGRVQAASPSRLPIVVIGRAAAETATRWSNRAATGTQYRPLPRLMARAEWWPPNACLGWEQG